MCELTQPRTLHEETFGISRALHDGATCEDCGEPTTEHGICPDCTELRRELEADDVWPVWLASLKTAWSAGQMDDLCNKLTGWRYVQATITHEKTSNGVQIASANDLVFASPDTRLFITFRRGDDRMPVVMLTPHSQQPDWCITFTAATPHAIILAAIAAN
jgi:hypothetical protein